MTRSAARQPGAHIQVEFSSTFFMMYIRGLNATVIKFSWTGGVFLKIYFAKLAVNSVFARFSFWFGLDALRGNFKRFCDSYRFIVLVNGPARFTKLKAIVIFPNGSKFVASCTFFKTSFKILIHRQWKIRYRALPVFHRFWVRSNLVHTLLFLQDLCLRNCR